MKNTDLIIELEKEKIQLVNTIKDLQLGSQKLYDTCNRIIEIFDTIFCLEQS